MTHMSTPAYRFGDLLALARQSWLAQMADGLHAVGYPDYRRSDALVLRLLGRGPVSIGRLGDALGVTRQAARKVADGLQRRGFATTARDRADARQVNLSLTTEGEAYARAVATVIERLNRGLSRRVRPADLAIADAVLRAVLTDDHTRNIAAHLAPPEDENRTTRGP
ncbi:MarR family winged helix-turn-helix transcriptional regulator [Leekyejoonella antrihumi]|uniref:MarR family transcriptional regulator n=1 Tax=Leekyejoonella antrihumi TaxID=1660198 RepID=A0A563DWP2_9MICO|nr:MarR family transcriptional regulator [Leekyejoonella antrihumi]TWP34549.1 MarR family transcriptional regulator [Leekyejoonella antrihumi]